MRQAIESHLASRQVSRVIYGAIIGLAVLVAIEDHPPSSLVVIGTLIGTAVAVGLAEFYSGLLGLYGFAAARLAGERRLSSALRGIAVAAVGAFLIGLKSLLH